MKADRRWDNQKQDRNHGGNYQGPATNGYPELSIIKWKVEEDRKQQ